MPGSASVLVSAARVSKINTTRRILETLTSSAPHASPRQRPGRSPVALLLCLCSLAVVDDQMVRVVMRRQFRLDSKLCTAPLVPTRHATTPPSLAVHGALVNKLSARGRFWEHWAAACPRAETQINWASVHRRQIDDRRVRLRVVPTSPAFAASFVLVLLVQGDVEE